MERAPLLTFSEVIAKRGIDASRSRLLRWWSGGMRYWRMGPDAFWHAASTSSPRSNPYSGASHVFVFIPERSSGGSAEQLALFVGGAEILNSWIWDGDRRPRLFTGELPGLLEEGSGVHDLRRLPDFDDLSERLVVRWGDKPSTTALRSRWADRWEMEVVELRQTKFELPFPGFGAFSSCLDEVEMLPNSWLSALSSVKGVYLLVCPDTGEQYVGSAHGSDGFWGRFSSYSRDGHGGNLRLRNRPRTNMNISILEVASPDASASEIISREAAWKIKLGTRARGLNAN